MRAYLWIFLLVTLNVYYGNCKEEEDAAKKTEAAPPLLPCGPHEIRIRCKVPCDYDSCKTLYTKVDCTLPQVDAEGNKKPCESGCVCETGYLRLNGVCIPKEQCPPEKPCGKNEYWDPNGTTCPQASCDFPNPDSTCVNKKPQPGCYCKEGYIRNPKNKCILPEDCSEYICCSGGNQTYVPCTFRCPKDVCPTDDWPMACKPPRNCPGGCGCLPGYRWNEDDECIHASDCPEITCTKPNTYWHPCSDPDLMEDCTNRQNQEDLPPPSICKPWCICQQGYFRDSSYNCVAEADCPP